MSSLSSLLLFSAISSVSSASWASPLAEGLRIPRFSSPSPSSTSASNCLFHFSSSASFCCWRLPHGQEGEEAARAAQQQQKRQQPAQHAVVVAVASRSTEVLRLVDCQSESEGLRACDVPPGDHHTRHAHALHPIVHALRLGSAGALRGHVGALHTHTCAAGLPTAGVPSCGALHLHTQSPSFDGSGSSHTLPGRSARPALARRALHGALIRPTLCSLVQPIHPRLWEHALAHPVACLHNIGVHACLPARRAHACDLGGGALAGEGACGRLSCAFASRWVRAAALPVTGCGCTHVRVIAL